MTQEQGRRVLVTGGTGYLAKWVIAGLLNEGYAVRATIRHPGRADALRAEIAAHAARAAQIEFAQADLLRDDGWDAAVRGCDDVLHVASPMGQGAAAEADLVTPARAGTLRVLRAAEQAGVGRVVVTSSGFAVDGAAGDPGAAEATWPDPSAKGVSEYARSKILAEQAAWAFMAERPRGFSLTTVLPGLILGPAINADHSGSLQVIARMLGGKEKALARVGFGIVDVRDLARLQVLAMRAPQAAGQRFLALGEFLWLSDMAAILRRELGEAASAVPRRVLPDLVVRFAALFDREARFIAPMLGKAGRLRADKARAVLGWQARPARETIVDCGNSLIA